MAWLSEEQAATALGVSFQTIRRRVGNGSLRSALQGSQLMVEVDVPDGADAALKLHTSRRSELPPEPASAPSRTPFVAPCEREVWPASTMATRAASAAPLTRARRWPIGALWLTVTLALFAAALGVLQARSAALPPQDAEAEHEPAVAVVQPPPLEPSQDLAAITAASAERERALTAELNAARTQVEQLTGEVHTHRQSVADLTNRLDQFEKEMASLRDRHESLTDQLAAAKAGVAMLKFKSSILDTVRQLADRLEQSLARNREAIVAAHRLPVIIPVDAPRDRRLPSGPVSEQDHYAVSLRPIVGQSD